MRSARQVKHVHVQRTQETENEELSAGLLREITARQESGARGHSKSCAENLPVACAPLRALFFVQNGPAMQLFGTDGPQKKAAQKLAATRGAVALGVGHIRACMAVHLNNRE